VKFDLGTDVSNHVQADFTRLGKEPHAPRGQRAPVGDCLRGHPRTPRVRDGSVDLQPARPRCLIDQQSDDFFKGTGLAQRVLRRSGTNVYTHEVEQVDGIVLPGQDDAAHRLPAAIRLVRFDAIGQADVDRLASEGHLRDAAVRQRIYQIGLELYLQLTTA
jgi:hypothetical protein